MNMKQICGAVALSILLGAAECRAYDTETHALITREAFAESALVITQQGSVPLVQRLGLDRMGTLTPFNDYWTASPQLTSIFYTDGGQSGVVAQGSLLLVQHPDYPEDFERCQMQEFLTDPVQQFQIFGDTVSPEAVAPNLDPLLPIQNWLVRGAIREDDMGLWTPILFRSVHCGVLMLQMAQPGAYTRSFNHFYDPVQNIGLTPCQPGGVCQDAVDWALGYSNSQLPAPVIDPLRRNVFSYEDARNEFYWALTRELNKQTGQPYTAQQRLADATDRIYLWATTFRSLGDVVHLLEDMGQPQHTRNDPHSAKDTPQQQAFEGYTNARVLGLDQSNPRNTGGYAQGFFGHTPPKALAPFNKPLGSYAETTPVMFATPAKFFADFFTPNVPSRVGMADYTNRGFFTGGTLPGSAAANLEPYPSKDLSTYAFTTMPCEGLLDADARLQAVTCLHYMNNVPDAVNPTYVDDLPGGYPLPPIASESVFRVSIQEAGVVDVPQVALGIAEMNTIANMALPRAVAYASGMINYFFRGSITITPPASGIYAIVDHGQQHSMNPLGYPCQGSDTSDGCAIFGFTQVQMNIQNSTASIVESGTNNTVAQSLSTGTLVAVARYHRNTCYEPDLSGEESWNMNTLATAPSGSIVTPTYPPGCPNPNAWNAGRTSYPEISKSAPLTVDVNGNIQIGGQSLDLNGNVGVLAQFDFSNDPIPINATDLFIEVVFQGVIGDLEFPFADGEANAVAVGSIDVSEPTYNTFIYLDNYFYDWVGGEGWMTVAQAQETNLPTLPQTSILKFDVCVNDSLLLTVGDGVSPSFGIAPGQAIRFATIFDLNAPQLVNNIYIKYTVPEDGWYGNGGTLDAGTTVSGAYGSFAELFSQSQNSSFVVHLAQAAMENDPANGAGVYTVTPSNSAVGATWGDNFFYFYQEDGFSQAVPQPPFPSTPSLTGSTGVFLPNPVIPPGQVYLNNSQPQTCGTYTPAIRSKSMVLRRMRPGIGYGVGQSLP